MPRTAGTLASEGQIARRKPGRPIGSYNKTIAGSRAKNKQDAEQALIVAQTLREKLAPFLPREDLLYLISTLEGTDDPSLERDLDIFLSLQLKAVLPALANEISGGSLLKETTSRSSVVKELLALRFQMEKHDSGEEKSNQYTFIQNVFEQRGLDSKRVASFFSGTMEPSLEELPRIVSGTPDGDEGTADEAGEISVPLPFRYVEVPPRSEE